MQMPGRINTNLLTLTGITEQYRFNYNGMEVDNEVSGNGNSYTTEFRQYDPRLGRWKSLDPLMMQFPHMSPYCAFDNNPIFYVDPYGLSSEGGPGDPITVTPVDNKYTQEAAADPDFDPTEGDLYFTGGTGYNYHMGSDRFEKGFYHCADYELMSDDSEVFKDMVFGKVKDGLETVDNAESGARIVQGGINQVDNLNIWKGKDYLTKGAVRQDDYFIDQNGNKKPLYSSGGKVKSDFYQQSQSSGYRGYRGLDNFVKKVGPLGTANDVWEVGESISEHGLFSKETGKQLVEKGAGFLSDRLLMIPTPPTIIAGAVIKVLLWTSGPSTSGGSPPPGGVDVRDNLHPSIYKPKGIKPMSFPKYDFSKPYSPYNPFFR